MKDPKKNSFTIFGIVYEFAWLCTQVSTCHAKIHTKFSYHDPFFGRQCAYRLEKHLHNTQWSCGGYPQGNFFMGDLQACGLSTSN